jgi:hypothetical protein
MRKTWRISLGLPSNWCVGIIVDSLIASLSYGLFDKALRILSYFSSVVLVYSIYNHIQDFIQRILGRAPRSQPLDYRNSRMTPETRSRAVSSQKNFWCYGSKLQFFALDSEAKLQFFLAWLCCFWFCSLKGVGKFTWDES